MGVMIFECISFVRVYLGVYSFCIEGGKGYLCAVCFSRVRFRSREGDRVRWSSG